MPTERTEKIFLVGAGGHGKVVLEALLTSGRRPDQLFVTDGRESLRGTVQLGIAVSVPEIHPDAKTGWFHVAIGNAVIRQQMHERLTVLGSAPMAIAHPAAVVSSFAGMGAGAFVAARAIIGPDAHLGLGSIINHGAVIDHDCHVGDFSHVAPNATLGGGARIGKRVLVGAGANILPGIQVGDDVVIGAGAVVIADIQNGERVVGVPARKIV